MKIKDMKELEKAKKEAMKLVKQRASASGVVAAIPLPGIDVAADIGLIMELLKKSIKSSVFLMKKLKNLIRMRNKPC